jgi:phenylacetate-CoA ligase
MPFIRYELGDYGAIERNQYNRYDRLVSLNGRVNDLAILPSGKRVPGFTLYYTARQVIQEINGIVEYQIEQIKIDAFIIYYVSTMEVSQDEEVFIKSTFIEYLEPGLEILVQRVDRIDRMKSGKFKHFISLSSGQE